MTMRLSSSLTLAIALLGALLCSPTASAQERKFELAAGVQYSFFTRTTSIDDDLGYHARFEWRVTPRIAIGAVYEETKTVDTLAKNEFDVDLELYGVQGTFVLSGEPAFQLLASAAVGTGDLRYDNPLINDPKRPDESSIEYWIQGGIGCQFRVAERLNLRLGLNVRLLSPQDNSLLLRGEKPQIVPALDLGFRF